MHSLVEEYRLKFDKQTREMVDIFDFIDKGMEINTNELENAEAKALLLKIFESADIKATQPGFFQLPRAIKKYKLRFFRLMRHVYKERYSAILDYLQKMYPVGSEDFEQSEAELEPEIKEETQEKPAEENRIFGKGNKRLMEGDSFNSIFGIDPMKQDRISRAGKYDRVLQKGGMRSFALEQIREQTGTSGQKRQFDVPLDRLINSKIGISSMKNHRQVIQSLQKYEFEANCAESGSSEGKKIVDGNS